MMAARTTSLDLALLSRTDDLSVAQSLAGEEILAEFGADERVEHCIGQILDALADGHAAHSAHDALMHRLSVLIGERRRPSKGNKP